MLELPSYWLCCTTVFLLMLKKWVMAVAFPTSKIATARITASVVLFLTELKRAEPYPLPGCFWGSEGRMSRVPSVYPVVERNVF